MEALSRALMELYDAATRVSLADFSGEALRIMSTVIRFDGAVWVTGECDAHAHEHAATGQDDTHLREIALLQEYAKTSAFDPAARAFLIGLKTPLCRGCTCFYRYRGSHGTQDMTSRQTICRLILVRDPPLADTPAKWLALYRSGDNVFTDEDKEHLELAWPHLRCAFSINRRNELSRLNQKMARRAVALASDAGLIEAADPQFITLLQQEWPNSQSRSLPPSVLSSWRRGHMYYGRRIEIAMQRQSAYIFCAAAARSSLTAELTETERIVVQRFAAGLSHKEIAGQLGVSNNTVRSHIAHAYSKLHVHDKAALAQLLGRERQTRVMDLGQN